MSQALHSVPGAVPTLSRRALAGLAAAWSWLAREIRLAGDRHALESMDDAGLADIGVSRGGFEDALRHGLPLRPTRQARAARRTGRPSALPPSVHCDWR